MIFFCYSKEWPKGRNTNFAILLVSSIVYFRSIGKILKLGAKGVVEIDDQLKIIIAILPSPASSIIFFV